MFVEGQGIELFSAGEPVQREESMVVRMTETLCGVKM